MSGGNRRVTQAEKGTFPSYVQFIQRHAGLSRAASLLCPFTHNLASVVVRSQIEFDVEFGSKFTGKFPGQISACCMCTRRFIFQHSKDFLIFSAWKSSSSASTFVAAAGPSHTLVIDGREDRTVPHGRGSSSSKVTGRFEKTALTQWVVSGSALEPWLMVE